jgi:hypothetical protein
MIRIFILSRYINSQKEDRSNGKGADGDTGNRRVKSPFISSPICFLIRNLWLFEAIFPIEKILFPLSSTVNDNLYLFARGIVK